MFCTHSDRKKECHHTEGERKKHTRAIRIKEIIRIAHTTAQYDRRERIAFFFDEIAKSDISCVITCHSSIKFLGPLFVCFNFFSSSIFFSSVIGMTAIFFRSSCVKRRIIWIWTVSKQMPLWENCKRTLESCDFIEFSAYITVSCIKTVCFHHTKTNTVDLECIEPEMLVMSCANRIFFFVSPRFAISI